MHLPLDDEPNLALFLTTARISHQPSSDINNLFDNRRADFLVLGQIDDVAPIVFASDKHPREFLILPSHFLFHLAKGCEKDFTGIRLPI